MINNIRIFIYFPLLILPIISFLLIGHHHKINLDLIAWKKQFKLYESKRFYIFLLLMAKFKDFRNLYYFRLKCEVKDKTNHLFVRILLAVLLAISEILLKKYDTLLISGNIGGGLVLVHAYYSILSPSKMGENCKIWHEVTIGYRHDKAPIIGDNVQISPGAKIIGDIKIGSSAKIGPNALVLESVPENSVVISQKGRSLNSD